MESVVECLDDKASAQEDGDFRAFDFCILDWNSCPGFIDVVFSEEQKLPLFNFQSDGLEFLWIVTRHSLDKLDEHVQFSRVQSDVCLGVVGVGYRVAPVWIGAFDLLADESPTSAGELHSFIIDLHLPLAVRIELFPSEKLVIRDDDGVLERECE